MTKVPGAGLVSLEVQHLGLKSGFCIGYPQVFGFLVGHGEKASNPSRNGVFGQRRGCEGAQFLERRFSMDDPEIARLLQVTGDVVSEYFECPVHARSSRYGGAGTSAKVGIIEVGEPVGCRLDLAPSSLLFPFENRVVGSETSEKRANGIAVSNDNTVDPSDLSGLGGNAQASGGPHEGEGGLRAGRRDLQGGGSARLGERSVSQEGSPPGGDSVFDRSPDYLWGKSSDGSSTVIEESGLTSEGFSVLDHADNVAIAFLEATAGDDDDLR